MTYYYTYKITLLKGNLKGKYYYGQHMTDNLDDGYHGSGRIIKDYFKHYKPVENKTYTKSILQFFNNLDELNEAEAKLIGDKYETDTMCLNLMGGGKVRKFSSKTKKKISDKSKGRPSSFKGKKHSKESKHKLSQHAKQRIGSKNAMFGKHQSEEARQKMSEKCKDRTWINNGEINKTVKNNLVCLYIEKGWVAGRITNQKSHNTGLKAINNGKEKKWVKPDEISEYLNTGWQLGFLKTFNKQNGSTH